NVGELHDGESDCGTANPAQAWMPYRTGFRIRAAQDENQKNDSADRERLERQYRAAKQHGEEAEDLEKAGHEMNQDGITVKGISPRVMWPSEASTCHRNRYSPGNNPVACVTSASAGLSLLISSACVKPAGPTSVSRERLPSMRTLNRSLIGTSG